MGNEISPIFLLSNSDGGCQCQYYDELFKKPTNKEDQDQSTENEICHYHLRGQCSWGSNCQNVHCDLPYQWRWRRRWSRGWTVFSEDENDEIERSFCDPTNESHIVFNHRMTIDFKSMSGNDYGGSRFEIERLSTPSSINHGNETWRTKWLWYWKNPKDKWIKFGELDNYEGCKAEIKSAELEEAFVADPTGEANFKTAGTLSFDYIVNFCNMIQRNTTFGTTRALCRQPEFINKLNFELNQYVPIAHYLNESDSEYTEIKSLFLQSLHDVHIKSIERIEHGDLWENYMMKKSKMLKKKTERQLGETRVFHGTMNNNIDDICKQGFDFRLNGQTA
ncbi:protein mono-ADP-ribosyltransferase PARP12-like, partial [Ruditapes philippinarum]|uniref:protein mono-ADP-ribosyltransferase PARP12-like n=1 Tax=Ruditapes philippinarum TaxID=129788 RepID=UPI00295BF081